MCEIWHYMDVKPGNWTNWNKIFSKVLRWDVGEEWCELGCEWVGQNEEQVTAPILIEVNETRKILSTYD